MCLNEIVVRADIYICNYYLIKNNSIIKSINYFLLFWTKCQEFQYKSITGRNKMKMNYCPRKFVKKYCQLKKSKFIEFWKMLMYLTINMLQVFLSCGFLIYCTTVKLDIKFLTKGIHLLSTLIFKDDSLKMLKNEM